MNDIGEVNLGISYNTKPFQLDSICHVTGHVTNYVIIRFYDMTSKFFLFKYASKKQSSY